MLDKKTMTALETISANLKNVGEIESVSYMRCDCSGGCTDNCYDCAETSGNQW